MARTQSDRQTRTATLRFEVDAGLLYQLGEQLVARRSVALAELIKNAYDADATKVSVLLENVTRPDGTIIVEDNGTGMTFEQVRDQWMRIATDDKVRNPISTVLSRPCTGAKGIGRFAVRRLASKLTLYSVAQRQDGAKERVVARFEWSDFKSGTALGDIPVPCERALVEESTPTGVMLYLERARDIWTEDDVTELRRDLLSLVSPVVSEEAEGKAQATGAAKDPGFAITLESAEFPAFEGELGEQFLAASWGVLTGDVDSAGNPRYHLVTRAAGEQADFDLTDRRFGAIPAARFRIHLFVYERSEFEGLDLGVRQAYRMGQQHGGVRIYQDGFRVFPYGDPGDDWLGLNEARARRTYPWPGVLESLAREVPGRPSLLVPGNNQLFGTVSISRLRQPAIELNVSRERLLHNDAYAQLVEFVKLGIGWMTIQYARLRADERAKKRKGLTRSVPEIIALAQQRLEVSTELSPESRREFADILQQAQERAEVEREEHISEISLLRVLASVGAAIMVMNHQLRAVLDGLREIHTDLSEVLPTMPTEIGALLTPIGTRIEDWHTMVGRQVSQLGFLLGRDARTRRRRLPLRKVVDEVTSPLGLYMRDNLIGFENCVPPNLKTPPVFEAELHAVLLQLFTNALKAVRDKNVRWFAVVEKQHDGGVCVRMVDTGGGVEPQMREEVFKAFVTTSAPDLILGVGTGLGLKIVRDIVEAYGGEVRFVDPEHPWHTCIEFVLPSGR